MKKIYLYGLIIIVLVFGLGIVLSSPPKNESILADGDQRLIPSQAIATSLPSGSEKIEVLHFHATQQCWSCITVGEYALKTIKERFPEEYEKGIIVFKDINGELLENREIVNKFKASGSSLFINAIKDGLDHIEEDVTVWRLISNEVQFNNYFEAKLRTIL